MKKTVRLAIVFCLFFSIWYIRQDYSVSKYESTVQEQPVENVSILVEADPRHLQLTVDNQSERAIVFNMRDARIEILRDGKWFQLVPKAQKVAWPTEGAAAQKVTTYDYEIKELIGRALRDGSYRLVLTCEGFGFNGLYRMIAEFTIQ